MTIDQTVAKLIEAKDAYYSGDPIMTDEEFDALEESLYEMDSDNDYFDIVGATIVGNKVKHDYPMLSMGKAKSIEEVTKWLNKISDKRLELIIEPKIDGLSCSVVYENGKLKRIATRGDGKEGQDITHIKDYIDIPLTISLTHRAEIRGELYIPKNSNVPNPNNKPLRSIAGGFVNRKNSGLEDLKYVKFVGYQVMDFGIKTEYQKLFFIQDCKIEKVNHKIIYSIDELEKYFELYKNSLRDEWEYETDGLVIMVNDCELHEEINSKYVVSHHNHYNIALKPPSESKWTVVKGITWQVSRNGSVIPVVNVEPIVIGGATIKNVTANNYENVKNLKINVGDKIHISRSNDVIPFLIEVKNTLQNSKLIPEHCPSCSTLLGKEGVHLVCFNKDCHEQIIQTITKWVQSNDMEQVSESTIRTLYDNCIIKSVLDLYKINPKKLEEIDGFGEKKIKNLMVQIDKSKSLNIVEFLSRLSIKLVGEKAIKKLGIKSVEDFWNFNNTTYKIGGNLIRYKLKNKETLQKLIEKLDIQDIQDSKIIAKVCMTGTGHKGRKELIKELEGKGYEFEKSVSKDIYILICEDKNGNSSKIKKAEKLGIKIMTYDEFF